MKHLVTISMLLFAISARVFAQGTTEEEFNYLTKGYAIQLSSGLDMKKGYTLKDLGNWPVDYNDNLHRSTSYKGLYRDGSSNPCAILMIYKRSDTGSVQYYCIPSMDAPQELWGRTLDQVRAATNEMGSGEMDATIIYGLMHLSIQEAAK